MGVLFPCRGVCIVFSVNGECVEGTEYLVTSNVSIIVQFHNPGLYDGYDLSPRFPPLLFVHAIIGAHPTNLQRTCFGHFRYCRFEQRYSKELHSVQLDSGSNVGGGG